MTRKLLGEIKLSEVLREGDPALLTLSAEGIVTLADFLKYAQTNSRDLGQSAGRLLARIKRYGNDIGLQDDYNLYDGVYGFNPKLVRILMNEQVPPSLIVNASRPLVLIYNIRGVGKVYAKQLFKYRKALQVRLEHQ